MVHNRDDGCRDSPFSDTAAVMGRMRQATLRELVVSGGAFRNGPCDALSPHGYYTIEDQVIPAIVAWIKAHWRRLEWMRQINPGTRVIALQNRARRRAR